MTNPIILPIDQLETDPVRRFFDELPDGDRTFFGEPVHGEATVQLWRHDPRAQRFVMLDDDKVVGYVGVVHGVGWSSHVAELRLIVAPAERGRGLGRLLARHGVRVALEHGSQKLVVEVVADQIATIALFTGLGFVPEALLEDHVQDEQGRLMDLIVLAHRGADSLAFLATAGAAEDLA